MPVFDGRSRLVAAINISVQSIRMGVDEIVASFVPVLKEAQAELRPIL
jgi:DNA-binding IclR family transcriptional regulator